MVLYNWWGFVGAATNSTHFIKKVSSMSEQSFQYTDDKSNKFWKISLDGKSFTVHFGRIGTAGQTQTKDFGSPEAAELEHDKLIAEKLRKGYVRVGEAHAAGAASAADNSASSAQPQKVLTKPMPTDDESTELPRTIQVSQATATVSDGAAIQNSKLTETPAAPITAATSTKQIVSTSEETDGQFPEYTFDWSDAAKEKSFEAALYVDIGMPLEKISNQFSLPMLDVKRLQILSKMKGHQQVNDLCAEISIDLQQLVALRKDAVIMNGIQVLKKLRGGKVTQRETSYLAQLAESSTVGSNFNSMFAIKDAGYLAFQQEFGVFVFSERRRILNELKACTESAEVLAKIDHHLLLIERQLQQLEHSRAAISRAIEQSTPPKVDEYVQRLAQEGNTVSDDVKQVLESLIAELEEAKVSPKARGFGSNIDLSNIKHIDAILAMPPTKQAEALIAASTMLQAKSAGLTRSKFSEGMRELILKLYKRPLPLKQSQMSAFIKRATELHKTGCALKSTGVLGVIERFASQGKFDPLIVEDIENYKTALSNGPNYSSTGRSSPDSADKSAMHELQRLLARTNSAQTSIPIEARGVGLGHEIADLKGDNMSQSPEWLTSALGTAVKGKREVALPSFLKYVPSEPVGFEQVVIDGWRLSDEQLQVILVACKQSTPEKLHPLLIEIRKNAPHQCFDNFVWDIFMRWQRDSSPQKERWCLWSIGMLGSEQLVFKLLPLMYKWRESGNAHHAFWGLECFLALGTDLALMKVHEISQTPKLKSLRAKALELMEKIAVAKGLSKAQLEDRIVPNCGLDENGARVFDYGSRKFFFVMAPGLKASVKDEDGKLKADLPEPTQKDDQQLARKEMIEWKELKKNIKSVAKIQAARLEQAMVTGRKWTLEEFEMFLLKHPLMCHFVRLLIWCGYDSNGKLIKTFRVGEDNKFSDQNDKDMEIADVATIGLVHTLNLTEDQRARWGEVMSDYEIVPPFQQLGRAIFVLTAEELDGCEITRFNAISIPAITVPSNLERLGWSRGLPVSHGYYHCHSKQFYESKLTAVVEYDKGIQMMMALEGEPQQITSCYILPGLHKPAEGYYGQEKFPLKEVDPVVISEVLNDLTVLTSKGKED